MSQCRTSIVSFGLALAPSLFVIAGLSPAPAEAARRDGTAYAYADAAYVTKSRDKARLDLIVCLQGVAGRSFPGGKGGVDKALEEAAFACGASANRVQPMSGEPDVLDIFDSIKECGFEPGDASPDADCAAAAGGAKLVPSRSGLVRSVGGDGPVTQFTLKQDLSVPVTVNWIGFDGVEHVASGGDSVRPGDAWNVENGAKGYESHWYSIRSGSQLLCSFALRQGAVVELSRLAACALQPAAGGYAFVADVVGLRPNEILSVRSGPSQGSDKVGALPGDARNVKVAGCNGSASGQWCEVDFEGLHGWVQEAQHLRDTAKRRQSGGEAGWWVIVGSERNPDNRDTGPANARVNDALAPCRFEAFSDWSAKWRGFQPGFSVSVLGPYHAQEEAEKVRRAASACVPDANVRQGTYAGE